MVKPSAFAGLELEDQLEFARLLAGQVGRLGTPQNPVNMS